MSIEEIVTGYHAAMVHKSADELAGLYAEDGRHEFPFGGLAAYEGREEIRAGYRAMWGATAFETKEVRRVALHHTLDPEVVVVEQETLVSAGERSITVPSLVVLRVRDGRIVHARDYMDTGVIAQVRAAAGA
ncbi:Ketosteroid isomerase-related protein [Nonomuraea solani]|uniref:Ketosteroid isomerase-related protein n=1 Tax=Nonomuraea solani TaxID=1144553 RepID=A0A1H6ESB4_9ACTN|nr:nuclear transport factor 2 family protein [Nonomuraea solani]SEH00273.1 Ketosteroid isomerase-related protein [Nonomuraea solani]